MKHVLSLFLCFFSITVFCQQPGKQTEIIYGRKDGMALTMVQLQPGTNKNNKAIIRIVSGNWVSGYNRIEYYKETSQSFVKAGFTVFLVMHGSQPRYAIPDAVADVQHAVRFIRYHAKDYSIDPQHIGITGASSGGNLSLLVALADEAIDTSATDPIDRLSARVQAAALYYPPTDFFNWGTPGATFIKNEKLLALSRVAGAFDFKMWNQASNTYQTVTDSVQKTALYKKVSPYYSVSPDDPPIFIIHGDKDKVVPLQQSQSIVEKLKAEGVINQFIVRPGGEHGWKFDEKEAQLFIDWFNTYLK